MPCSDMYAMQTRRIIKSSARAHTNYSYVRCTRTKWRMMIKEKTKWASIHMS